MSHQAQTDQTAATPAKKTITKFALLCVILLSYFGYLSYEYGLATGGVVAALTWSFFVLCTPIADAGFLLDFPMRLLFGIRMVASEVIVWAIAITLNLVVFFGFADYYNTTPITQIFYKILANPYPYWAVIVLSAAGTFMSVMFGDEVFDSVKDHKAAKGKTDETHKGFLHNNHWKHELIMIAFFAVVVVIYYHLASTLGIEEFVK